MGTINEAHLRGACLGNVTHCLVRDTLTPALMSRRVLRDRRGIRGIRHRRASSKGPVYVDGFRITLDADDSRDVYSALSTVKPQRIQSMEVYPNAASIPAEFLADACAVVVIWTKRD